LTKLVICNSSISYSWKNSHYLTDYSERREFSAKGTPVRGMRKAPNEQMQEQWNQELEALGVKEIKDEDDEV